MVDEKRRKAAEISEESRRLRLALIKQKEEDARKKIHLIREIKASRTTRPDPVESSGLGFLCEVSMTELGKKVLSAKARLKEEAERRNTVIRQEHERRRNLMRSNQQFLERYKATRQAIYSSSNSQAAIIDFPEIERLWRALKERKTCRCEEQKR
ncbi:hypothetical protein DMN91_009972 [Ooceraea biroi]|uniref:Uncharacterized protein n=1 Tax=Ooceraea biroi TaxID=2015173 RepID=A0A3L8DB54_OOCBI|nr:uncharacterized protein LOC105278204 [Ooceraea biroi]RLU17735.1 hypothetical protein DMN91_009972 [Ooceraea biroi]